MVEIESGRMEEKMCWGTWEELILGGAVLRHGTRDWDAVATELRSRTFHPFFFTPEVCKTKYQEVQKRYFGCTTGWFEELRKQRVAELKRELEKSQGSIGSLESKLESLKSEKNDENNNANYPAGNTESPPSVSNVARTDFPSIRDGLSATEETQTDSSPPAAVLTEIKTEEGENATSKENILKKRRGKRKRKECKDRIFPSLVDNREFIGDQCNDNVEKEVGNHRNNRVEEENVDLMSVLNSIVESENLSVFHKRTDSQRRGRYKKTIRRHMDLSLMRSQISDGTITSAKELYRDLLLLCNNAIFFYSKESRECKAALSLRDFVTRTFWKNTRVSRKDSGGCSSVPPLEKPVDGQKVKKPTKSEQDGPKVVVNADKPADGLKVKKPTIRAQDGPKVAVKASKPADDAKVKKPTGCVQDGPNVVVKADKETIRDGKNGCEAEVPVESAKGMGKKKVDRPVKVGRTGGSKRVETPVSGRKKPRKR